MVQPVGACRVDRVAGRDVVLVERFDRTSDGARRTVVSAHTILALDEVGAPVSSYADLAETIRFRFTRPKATLRELFSRIQPGQLRVLTTPLRATPPS
jgi:serine/threonine-protein kinase HipA